MKTLGLVFASSTLGLACGGGMEEPPVCPTGDCTLPSRTILKWTLNSYPDLLFQGDTCQDLDVKMVRVELSGIEDPTVFDVKEVECNQAQASFLGLPAGNYNAVVTPLDSAGEPMVTTGATAIIPAGTADVPTTTLVNVPFESWLGTYTGTFLFRLSWAGASCETAIPSVVTQTLTLMVDGGTVAQATTDVGQKMDGSDPKPCRKLSESFAQFAEGIATGPATLTVTGRDAADAIAFETTFDTFVGAAKNNPTITFDVAAPPPPPMP